MRTLGYGLNAQRAVAGSAQQRRVRRARITQAAAPPAAYSGLRRCAAVDLLGQGSAGGLTAKVAAACEGRAARAATGTRSTTTAMFEARLPQISLATWG